MRRCPCSLASLVGLLLLAGFSGSGIADEPACSIRLTDVTARSGITFRHTDGGSGQRYIVESVVAGVATFDYDGDGWIDIYFLNGAPLQGTALRPGQPPPRHALYRNNGDWTFTDVTEQAGLRESGYGLGVVAGDYDNDGDPDLFLNNFGRCVLWANNGDGTFSDGTDRAGVAGPEHVGAGASFFDMDSDGDLDLFVASYVDFTYENHVVRTIGKHRFHAGPKDYRPTPDRLYRNEGDGTFRDVSGPAGIAAGLSAGMGTLAFDYDDDGDTDILVCNDAGPNLLFQNDGQEKFAEVGLLAGVAYDGAGNPHSNMGVDSGDYDGDGRLDLFITGFSSQAPILFRNLGRGQFEDATNRAGVAAAVFAPADWGAGLVDFDGDGDRDLFVACGHFNDNIHHIDARTALKVPNVLLMNTGGGKFADVSRRCGDGLKVVESTRGAAFDDLDNDGDMDAVLLNANAPPTILRNDSPLGAWLQVRLQGRASSREGIGARVRVTAAGRTQVAEVHAGRGYQSHYGSTLHFGLGGADRIERVEVRWPGKGTTVLAHPDANRVLTVRE